MDVDGVVSCNDGGAFSTAQGLDMEGVAVVIIQKENILIPSCKFDREHSCKTRVDYFRRHKRVNENSVRSHRRCDRINATS